MTPGLTGVNGCEEMNAFVASLAHPLLYLAVTEYPPALNPLNILFD